MLKCIRKNNVFFFFFVFYEELYSVFLKIFLIYGYIDKWGYIDSKINMRMRKLIFSYCL